MKRRIDLRIAESTIPMKLNIGCALLNLKGKYVKKKHLRKYLNEISDSIEELDTITNEFKNASESRIQTMYYMIVKDEESEEWRENLSNKDFTTLESLRGHAQSIIDNFNATLKPNEQRRFLVNVGRTTLIDETLDREFIQKTDLCM